MTALSFSLILSGVLLNAAGQLLLKAGANRVGEFSFTWRNVQPIALRLATEPRILAALACFAVGVAVWVLALSRVEVSVAYPMLSIGYVVNAFAARHLFGEAVTARRMGGIAMIALGVYIVARS